ncbi:uncharacterized protein LOC121530047 [Drosophila eugracilis]|uniref:uncharacterized protein LOC121530047 n=1 Tax=Drosophila eugracilis TaxID=29029 RepID=UPI001BDAEA24|nr:uncharacterized protein LOC121530047 [Drosophila eugracilis]
MVGMKEEVRKVGNRVNVLETDFERRNPVPEIPLPLMRPRTEYELKESSPVPECIKTKEKKRFKAEEVEDEGTVWKTNGVFKLAHVINLGHMQQLIDQVANEAMVVTDQRINALVGHYLQHASEVISRMVGAPTRRQRSIDWLGSAWKWVAGSPDKSDWNAILKEEDSLARNNNQQIRINTKLWGLPRDDGRSPQSNYINEMLRASQLGKTGVVNTNLLDHNEVDTILAEVDSLPYQNVVEAIEFSKPTILTNGTAHLYILAKPKVVERRYRLMRIYPTISDGKHVVLKYNTLAMDRLETYALLGKCVSIGNTTVC